jgi:hypothetical protein
MLWPYHWTATRGSPGPSGGPGGADPYAALRALITAEYRFEEAAATDNVADSVGARHLTSFGDPGVGGTYRTFNGTTQWADRSTLGDDALGLVNRVYTVSANFRTSNPVTDGTTHQVVSLREDGSASAKLTFILRRESNALKIFHGNGLGAFTSFTIGNVAAATQYHFIFRVNNVATGDIDYRLDGAAVVNWPSAQAGTTTNEGLHFSVGGDVNELWNDRIYRVRVYSGTALTDAQMLLDYQDTQGV